MTDFMLKETFETWRCYKFWNKVKTYWKKERERQMWRESVGETKIEKEREGKQRLAQQVNCTLANSALNDWASFFEGKKAKKKQKKQNKHIILLVVIPPQF